MLWECLAGAPYDARPASVNSAPTTHVGVGSAEQSAALAAAAARRIGLWETSWGRNIVLEAIENGLMPPDDVELLTSCFGQAFSGGDEE